MTDEKYNNIRNNNKLNENFDISVKKLQRQSVLCEEIAQTVLKSVFNGIPADRCLSQIMRRRKELGSRDRRLLYDLIFALFRWKGWIGRWEKLERMEHQFLASLVMDGKLDHPVIHLWTNKLDLPDHWLKSIQLKAPENKIRLMAKWCLQSQTHYDWDDLFPDWFIEGLQSTMGKIFSKKEDILSIFQTRPPIWIRFREENLEVIEKSFLERGISFQSHSILSSAGSVNSPVNLDTLNAYREGMFEIQDLSSQIVGWVCNPQFGEYWWDACAGGGGKTLHLAALIKGNGKILATDKRESALNEARHRCRKWNYHQVRFKIWKGEEGEGISSLFDGVLLDAPCSGTGTWRRNADARWRTSISDVENYVQLQKKLLFICAQKVRPEGKLIYSVCSLMEQETLLVIHEFIESQSEFELGTICNPLTQKKSKGFLWVFPQDQNSDGMFIASLKKKRANS